MEKVKAKFFLSLFCVSAFVWIATTVLENIEISKFIEFGTVQFKKDLDPADERTSYAALAEYSLVGFISYSITVLSAVGFVMTTNRSLKNNGWLLMSAILLFVFVPVELYCFWLEWKLVGLEYWGEWSIEEFRNAFLTRLTALAGLPFIAQLCYYTIPILIIFKPLQKKTTA